MKENLEAILKSCLSELENTTADSKMPAQAQRTEQQALEKLLDDCLLEISKTDVKKTESKTSAQTQTLKIRSPAVENKDPEQIKRERMLDDCLLALEQKRTSRSEAKEREIKIQAPAKTNRPQPNSFAANLAANIGRLRDFSPKPETKANEQKNDSKSPADSLNFLRRNLEWQLPFFKEIQETLQNNRGHLSPSSLMPIGQRWSLEAKRHHDPATTDILTPEFFISSFRSGMLVARQVTEVFQNNLSHGLREEKDSESKETHPLSIYLEKFNELKGAVTPNMIADPITNLPMENPVFRAKEAKDKMVFDLATLKRLAKNQQKFIQPYIQKLVDLSEYKEHPVLRIATDFYWHVFNHYYNALCRLPEKIQSEITENLFVIAFNSTLRQNIFWGSYLEKKYHRTKILVHLFPQPKEALGPWSLEYKQTMSLKNK